MIKHSSCATKRLCPAFFLLIASLAAWAPIAGATQANCTASTANASITLDSSVSVSSSTPAGTLLGNSSPPVSVTFSCTDIPGGQVASIMARNLAPRDASDPPAGGGIRFATTPNPPSGVALLLTASPTQPLSNGGSGYTLGTISTATGTLNVTYTAQLVRTTGPVAPGTLGAINLLDFYWIANGNTLNPFPASLSLVSGTRVTVPSCNSSVTPSSTIALPTVSTSALPMGKTAGTTPFSIALAGCPSGLTMASAYFESAATVDTATGNLLNNNGTASNVEVQLLNGTGSSNASAGSAINLGAAAGAQNSGQYPITGGAGTMNYYARYVAIGAGAGPGSVNTSVMFTIDYP